MSVEEMIEAIEQNRGTDTYTNYKEDVLNALIAALKAGQAMRASIEVYETRNAEHARIEHKAYAAEACQAWDEATKGDV